VDRCLRCGVVKFFRLRIYLKRGLFSSFFLGFLVRLIPEVLSYPCSIGFDTVYYAFRLEEGVIWYHWSKFFTETWLLYALLIPVYRVFGGNPFLFLKVISPVLYGLNSAGVYFFARRYLRWGVGRSFVASFVFCFGLGSLRISWDLYRNILGMALLLFTLPFVLDVEAGRRRLLFVFLSLLTVFSHEYAALTLLFVVFWIVLKNFRGSGREEVLRLFAAVFPCLIVFLVGVFLRMFPVRYYVETNVVYVRDRVVRRPFGLFFLVDYLGVSTPVQRYATYFDLVLSVLFLFVMLYGVWLPLVLLGFFRDRVLDGWIVLLLVGSFSCLVTPFCALDLWNRWMFMLAYPFSFYAANGIEKVFVKFHFKWFVCVDVGLVVLFGVLFMVLPLEHAVFYSSWTCSYLPSSMLQSTVPLEDVDGVVNCFEWLNRNMGVGSCVLVHHCFLWWAKLYLDENFTIVYFSMNLSRGLEVALEKGFGMVYLVWWNVDTGWYDYIEVPEGFKPVYSSGRISVYVYCQ